MVSRDWYERPKSDGACAVAVYWNNPCTTDKRGGIACFDCSAAPSWTDKNSRVQSPDSTWYQLGDPGQIPQCLSEPQSPHL